MSDLILRTKLFVPALRPSLVVRSRLLTRIAAGATGRVVLVVAPAGFGKTTLVTHWLSQQSVTPAWLSLDEYDNEPRRFFSYLLAAIQTVYPTLGQTLATALNSTQPPDDQTIIATLLNEISALDQPLILILDDYHIIVNEQIHDAVAMVVDYLPPQSHLILTSRDEPPLPLSRWRARGQLGEIRQQDLRFDAVEAAAFLAETMGLQLDIESIESLKDRTEGWIAGLQLAAVSLQNHQDSSRFITAFQGNDRHIADYLIGEVLQQQPEEIHRFLLQIAILERFNAALGNTVLAIKNSHDILAKLDQANLFLIPLDNQRHWYRFHHLFAQLLRQQLELAYSEAEVTQLHRRAIDWYREHGYVEEAINHALHIADFDLAAELVSNYSFESLYDQGGTTLVKRWYEELPTEAVRRHHVRRL